MDLFENRFDSKYRNDLMKRLSFDGENGLINTAITIKEPFRNRGTEYKKVVRIDFVGIAATTLFDAGGNFNDPLIAKRVEKIFDDIIILNEKGIFLRMRLLFIYPYSDYSFTMIQAETSKIRSSIEEPEFVRDFKFVEEVTEKNFYGSTTFINQQNSLIQIEDLIRNHNLNTDNLNSIRVRFTPSPINTCMLLLNETGYFDSYLLAKQNRRSNKLSYQNPIKKITKRNNECGFKAFEDHFRYLWTLDTTLYCEDATKFDSDTKAGLADIIPPLNINFDNKARRIKNRLKRTNPKEEYSEDEINAWKFKLTHLLGLSTQLTRISPQQETLFITCSWKKDRKKQKYIPNAFARKISIWLNRDFGIKSEKPCMKINIMEAAIGSFLFQQLYKTLDETTLAIIIMTKDIKSEDGVFFCKPNVYHELGFLMKHLSNSTRVAVLLEEGVYEPSNIKSLARIEFNKNNFDEKYLDLIDWLEKSKTFINNSYFDTARNNQKLKESL